MALYPDTSCFYRAEVIASPQDVQPSGRVWQSHVIAFCWGAKILAKFRRYHRRS
jgi:hypothetical protein